MTPEQKTEALKAYNEWNEEYTEEDITDPDIWLAATERMQERFDILSGLYVKLRKFAARRDTHDTSCPGYKGGECECGLREDRKKAGMA